MIFIYSSNLMIFKQVAYNVEHWRGLGICCYVRPADALNKERKF